MTRITGPLDALATSSLVQCQDRVVWLGCNWGNCYSLNFRDDFRVDGRSVWDSLLKLIECVLFVTNKFKYIEYFDIIHIRFRFLSL